MGGGGGKGYSYNNHGWLENRWSVLLSKTDAMLPSASYSPTNSCQKVPNYKFYKK